MPWPVCATNQFWPVLLQVRSAQPHCHCTRCCENHSGQRRGRGRDPGPHLALPSAEGREWLAGWAVGRVRVLLVHSDGGLGDWL